MTEVAKYAVSVDPALRVHRAVGRVKLSELDSLRETFTYRPPGGMNFYLMSALDQSADVPEDAIDLIKRMIGRAFRANAERFKALFRTNTGRSAAWALLESQGHNVRLRSAAHGPSSNFLTYLELPADMQHRMRTHTVRILLEYVPPPEGRGEPAWYRLAQSLQELASSSTGLTTEDVETATDANEDDASPRERILARSLTATQVLKASEKLAEDASSWASRERKGDRLFGVWSRNGREFVHPDFQFRDGYALPRLPELLKVLRTRVGFDPVLNDKGGWARAYWLYQPHPGLSAQALAAETMDLSDAVNAALQLDQLDGAARSPAEMFGDEPDAVIALAKELADGSATHE